MNSLEKNEEDSKEMQEIENERSRLSSIEYYEYSSNKKDIKNKCYKRIIVTIFLVFMVSLLLF